MQGSNHLADRQHRLIARLARVEDAALLDAVESLLDEHDERMARLRLVPLEESDVDAILKDLLPQRDAGS
ncbi:MAG TPA: hypothetical protein VKB31_04625 [Trueperaceae bacterium]|nr:hypothetical protein [Trueperaceae bacterium]